MPPRDPDERELEAVRSGAGQDDLDILRRLGEVARSVTDEDAVLDEPPPGLWDRIAAATAGTPAGSESTPTAAPESAAEPANGARGPAPAAGEPGPQVSPAAGAPPRAGAAEPGGPDVPGVTPIRGAWRRRQVRAWMLAAAAAVVVLVVGAVSLVLGGGDGETVVAAARLEPLAAAEPATAALVEADGRLELDLPLAGADLPPTGGFYEVWLMDTDVQRLISLGPVRPDATYAVPGGIDYHDYPVVDVSVEPSDGDPSHSGDSILRGTLS